VLAAISLLACPSQPDEPSEERGSSPLATPIVLFGVDGLEWSVLLPLVQSGRAPNFAALMERGTFGTLGTLKPTTSPVIWTTIATGKGPGKHGITGFTYDEETESGTETLLFSSGHRRTKAFWNILSTAGVSVDVIGWWVTYPAEEIRGLMVSQTNTSGVLRKGALAPDVGDQVWPPELEPAMLAELRHVEEDLPGFLRENYGEPSHPIAEFEKRAWRRTHWSFRADETYQRIALKRLQESPSRLTAVYMGAPDVVGHRFWRHAFPEQFEYPPDPEQIENFGGLLEATYRRTDRALGELLEAMPPETAVFVVSDHGMEAKDTGERFGMSTKTLSGGHVRTSVLIAAGSGIKKHSRRPDLSMLEVADLERFGGVQDVTPTLLVLLGLPYGEDMDGRPLTALIDSEWLALQPPKSVATHDTAEWLSDRKPLSQPRPSREKRLEQLRALGYIE
jgi:predicted AlkP superfamily phosphohydrolase/phosphomutase